MKHTNISKYIVCFLLFISPIERLPRCHGWRSIDLNAAQSERYPPPSSATSFWHAMDSVCVLNNNFVLSTCDLGSYGYTYGTRFTNRYVCFFLRFFWSKSSTSSTNQTAHYLQFVILPEFDASLCVMQPEMERSSEVRWCVRIMRKAMSYPYLGGKVESIYWTFKFLLKLVFDL